MFKFLEKSNINELYDGIQRLLPLGNFLNLTFLNAKFSFLQRCGRSGVFWQVSESVNCWKQLFLNEVLMMKKLQ